MRNTRKKLSRLLSVLSICLITSVTFSDAHSGRTDSNGGHKDNKNKSGLGNYHYHCGGYGPHLHTNGCPYGGGSSSSSSVNSSTQNNKASIEKQKEREKEKVSTKGFNEGYSDGYNGKLSNPDYSGNYSDTYEIKYEEGYDQGKERLESEKVSVEEEGYRLGIEGSEIDENKYENEELNIVYKNAYDRGITEYKAKKISEYTQLGLTHGQEDKEMIELNDLDESFATAYKKAYEQGQDTLENTYMEKGYYQALKNTKYISPKYKNDKYIAWYEDGFNKGIQDIETAIELGYNDGYSKNEIKVPDNLKLCEDIYLENYKKGEKQSNKDFASGTTGLATIVGVGWITRRYSEAKKSIK